MVEDNSTMPFQKPSKSTPEMLSLQKTLEAGKTVLGIDIGVSSVNVAQSAFYRERQTLIKVVVEEIPIVNERDRDKAMIEALKRALSKFNIKNADIICIMPSLLTSIETLLMPVMPRNELVDAVKLEVNSSQYFVIDNPILDFQILGRTVDKGVQKMNVLVAAAAKTAVDGLLTNFISQKPKPVGVLEQVFSRSVGLRVDAVVPLSVALENFVKQSKIRRDETVALIEMGTTVTELNVYRNHQLELSRKVRVTGLDLTRSLMSPLFTSGGKLELTMEKAEAIKREFGIPAPGENYLIEGKITAGQVLSLLRPKLEQLAAEINRSFDHYQEKTRDGKVDRIIIFGGAAKLKGLPEFLSAELGLPVDLGNPLEDVELLFDGVIADQDDPLRLIGAIGASLGDGSQMNLLPESLKEWKKRAQERMAVITGTIIFLVLLGFIYFGCLARMALMHERELVAERGYQALVPQLQELKNGLLLKKMIRNRPDLGGYIKQLSYLPDNVYLTELNFNSGSIYLSGFVVESDKKAKAAPAHLVEWLKKGIMPDAKLSLDQKNVPGKAAKLFEIEGHIGVGGGT